MVTHEKTKPKRLLEQPKVGYEPFVHDPPIQSAVEAATALSVPAQQVYNTCVMLRDPACLTLASGPNLAAFSRHVVAA
jgi:hypothetical protein